MNKISLFFIAAATGVIGIVSGGCTPHYAELPSIPDYPEFTGSCDKSAVIEVLPDGQDAVENELRSALRAGGYINFSADSYYKKVQSERIKLITLQSVSRYSYLRPEGWYLDTRIIVSVREPGIVWNNQLTYRRPRYFQAFGRYMTGNIKPSALHYSAGDKAAVKNLFSIKEFREALAPEKFRHPLRLSAGSSAGMWKNSLLLQRGNRGNIYEAVRWAFLASVNGNREAFDYIVSCSIINNIFGDNRMLFSFVENAAKRGHIAAAVKLAGMYEQGIGVSQNSASAFYWYRYAAGKGNAQAQFQTGFYLEEGRGVAKNTAQALFYYRLAAKQGYPGAKEKAENLSEE